MTNRALLLALALAPFASACSSNAAGPADAGTAGSDDGPVVDDDAAPGDDAAGEAGPAAFAPASHAVVPQVEDFGGPVLATPKIVPVSFPDDPLQTDIDTFVAAFSSTTYWGDVTREYGVGPATPLAPVHVTTAVGATIDDSAIQTWLASMLDGTHPEFPAPDGNTVYALFYPPGTTVTMQGYGSSCNAFHGYHSEATVAGDQVPYAVIPRCTTLPEIPVTGIQYVSAVTSHEVVEAMTDPHPFTNPAFAETDPEHIAWTFLGLGEVGDMCALVGNAFYTPADFPYTVQRIYSNALAKAGHDPCFPNPMKTTYIQAAPVLGDTVSFDDEGYRGTTKGVKIPLGQSKTVEIDLFSDAPTSGPWTVSAVEPSGAGTLGLSFDKTSGQNGDKLHLTITAKSTNATYGLSPFIVESSQGTTRNLWVGLVGN